MTDLSTRFEFPALHIRGVLVQLQKSSREILANASYNDITREALAGMLAASALFCAGLKNASRVSTQFQSAGPLNLIYAECTSQGDLRGVARWQLVPGAEQVNWLRADAGQTLAITIEQLSNGARYQGLVDIQGSSLNGAFENYFLYSEQLPTIVRIFVDNGAVSAFMLQTMPQYAERVSSSDDWQRMQILLQTLSSAEATQLEAVKLLGLIFAQDDVLILDHMPLRFSCKCSDAKVDNIIVNLGQIEADEIVAELGAITITCEFCGRSFSRDGDSVEKIFHSNIIHLEKGPAN
jgi:molecular chaperone Hsp33